MTRRDDSMSFRGSATGRAPRAGFGRRGVVRLSYGGVAIVGAIATLRRTTGARGQDGRCRTVHLAADSRSGGACGSEILGISGRRPTGASSGVRAIDVGV